MSHFWKQSERKAIARLKSLVPNAEIDMAVHNVTFTFTTLKALLAFLTSVAEDEDVAERFIAIPHGEPQPKKKHWHYALDVWADDEDKTKFHGSPQIRVPPEDLLYILETLGGEVKDLLRAEKRSTLTDK